MTPSSRLLGKFNYSTGDSSEGTFYDGGYSEAVLGYTFRRGEVSLDREDPDFFANNAHLHILRTGYRFLTNWEILAEVRMLHLPDLSERKTGALLSISRYLGDHFKVGIGYNFTDFSEDLTDLSNDHHGIFLNFTGSL